VLKRSVDDGATRTKPVEITGAVKPPDWGWYATGPGVGIQLKSGRLLVPCDHRENRDSPRYASARPPRYVARNFSAAA